MGVIASNMANIPAPLLNCYHSWDCSGPGWSPGKETGEFLDGLDMGHSPKGSVQASSEGCTCRPSEDKA